MGYTLWVKRLTQFFLSQCLQGLLINLDVYCTIIFTVPARIVDKPPSSVLIKRLNEVVRLTCTADGSPTPTIHWEKNGHQALHAKVKSLAGLGLVKSELILKYFTPNQSDVYSCVARNTPLRTVKTTTRVGMLTTEINTSWIGW